MLHTVITCLIVATVLTQGIYALNAIIPFQASLSAARVTRLAETPFQVLLIITFNQTLIFWAV